jgi:two-component system OmpR family sensor kinase
MMAWSLRRRMMLMFCGVVGVLLAACFAVFYVLLSREVYNQLDRQLLHAASPVVADLQTDSASEKDVDELNLPGQYFELVDLSGRVLQQSRNLPAGTHFLGAVNPADRAPSFQTLKSTEQGRLRLAAIPFQFGRNRAVLVVAASTASADHVLATFRGIILLVLPLSLLLTAVVSAWYVGRSLAPIATFTRHAEDMAGRVSGFYKPDSWQPLPVKSPRDELSRLAETFNRLFDRVASAHGQLRQFVSDASHELRTPLSVLQGETELVLAEPRTPLEYEKTLRVIDGELRNLSRIVEGLFTLAMADAGQLRLARDPVYINEILEGSCALVTPLAKAKNIAIQRELSQDFPYLGDEAFLRQLFLIFLENAVKYSPPQTTVTVGLQQCDGTLQARFQDQGIGVSPKQLAHIFKRFYRAGQPGTSDLKDGETAGAGLGLAIADAITKAMGGWIDCRSEPSAGSTFTVNLPLQQQTEEETSRRGQA